MSCKITLSWSSYVSVSVSSLTLYRDQLEKDKCSFRNVGGAQTGRKTDGHHHDTKKIYPLHMTFYWEKKQANGNATDMP